MTQEQNPLFKLIDQKTRAAVFVVQARDADQADERIAVVLSVYRNAPWLEEPDAFEVEEHNPIEPLHTPTFLDGFFAVLSEAFCGKSTH
jgi:hypothetical protein